MLLADEELQPLSCETKELLPVKKWQQDQLEMAFSEHPEAVTTVLVNLLRTWNDGQLARLGESLMAHTSNIEALVTVADERIAQDRKWGEQNHDDLTWLAILSEEIGETAQAILHDKFGGKAAGTVRDELVQVAAVALAFIECIDRRTAKREREDVVMGNELKPVGHSSWGALIESHVESEADHAP